MTFVKGFATGAFTSLACFYVYNSRISTARKKHAEDAESIIKQNRVVISSDDPMLEDVKKLENQRKILKYGIPDKGPEYYVYENHVLNYDQSRKIPSWVAEHITQDKLKGEANRKHSYFKPDPNLNSKFNAGNDDYLKSGWSRGHMTPAGNHKYNQKAMNDSFYLSNVVPQNYENNAGFWNRFELYCRDLTKKFKDVRVITGPVFLPDLEESEDKIFIKYQLIGKRQVAVPTHLYKVVIAESDNNKPIALGAFIVPNKPIGYDKQLTDFMVPLEILEEKTGLTLLPKLDQSMTKNLCSVDSCQLISRDKFELYFIGRRLQTAKNLDQLNKIYNEIAEKKLKPDDYLIKLFKEKEWQLKEQELMGKKQRKEL
ncbi:nuclease EXOG, mitochondrial [Patella vulgata]|uniref:nuclease EXOG, mitochondrial n=1 Tax=Patella vulgata TaxID=6465 RepID=UPI00217F6C44|nr:nuclease EXOG, mitochondrial [Patella vulgata]